MSLTPDDVLLGRRSGPYPVNTACFQPGLHSRASSKAAAGECIVCRRARLAACWERLCGRRVAGPRQLTDSQDGE